MNSEEPKPPKKTPEKRPSTRLKDYFIKEQQKKRVSGADEWFRAKRRPFGW